MSTESAPAFISIYAKLFRNPAAIIFFLLFLFGYTVLFLLVTSSKEIDVLELIKAAPFAVSAVVL
ncbi:hypothetical protein, partial [Vibrio parahaemolyticus]|uniref:hypothetical protein n=1 Tax=Vibrio parahaemolyticus TaxID=670 RepID=UPI001C608D75